MGADPGDVGVTMATAREVRVPDGVTTCVRRIHALFQETLGNDAVEDLVSFRLTVSPSTNPALAPKLVEAYEGNRLIGAVLGVYLRRVNGGIVLYAGVREPFRRQGLYTEMRKCLLFELDTQRPQPVWGSCSSEVEDRLVGCTSEVPRRVGSVSSRRWTTFSPPSRVCRDGGWTSWSCLRLQARRRLSKSCPAIVRELFTSVYRITEPEDDPDFRHVVDSIGTS